MVTTGTPVPRGFRVTPVPRGFRVTPCRVFDQK